MYRIRGLLQQHSKFRDKFLKLDKQAAQAGKHLPRVSMLTSGASSPSFMSMRDTFRDCGALNTLVGEFESQLQGSDQLDCFVRAVLAVPGGSLSATPFENATRFGNRRDIREILCDRLGYDECLLVWHVPAAANLPIACYLAFWEVSQEIETVALAENERQLPPRVESHRLVVKQHNIRVLACRAGPGRTGGALLATIQSFVDAVIAQPATMRWGAMDQALQRLSECLGLPGIIEQLPAHVQTVVNCVPPCLRLVPWAALPVAPAATGSLPKITLLDLYTIRTCPSIAEWELLERVVDESSHGDGDRSLVCVDGSDVVPDEAAGGEADLHKVQTAQELKLADLECTVVASAWAQQAPSHWIAAGEMASPQAICTDFHTHPARDRDDRMEHALRGQAAVLERCSVLNICAGAAVNSPVPALRLCAVDVASRAPKMTATDIVKQLWLKECRLVVLSRYTLLECATSTAQAAAAVGVVDAFLLAGATSVMHPTWAVHSTSSIVCSLLITLKMTENLPSFRTRRTPLVEALRSAQLWVRSAFAQDCKDLVARSDLSDLGKYTLLELLELIISVNTATGQITPKPLFMHPFFWANFQLVGAGCGLENGEHVAVPETGGQLSITPSSEELEEQCVSLCCTLRFYLGAERRLTMWGEGGNMYCVTQNWRAEGISRTLICEGEFGSSSYES